MKTVDGMKLRTTELMEVVTQMQSEPDNLMFHSHVTEGEDITQRVHDLKDDLTNKSSEIDDVIMEWSQLEEEVAQLSANVDLLEAKVGPLYLTRS